MEAYEQLTRHILNHAKPYIDNDDEVLRTQLAEVFENVILDLPGPRVVNRQLDTEQRFFSTVFYGFMEVFGSYEALKDFEVLIRRFPFSNTSIKKTRYMRLVIEAYLAENYILKERMIAYLTSVGRLFKGHKRHAAVLSQTRPLFKVVSDTLKPLTDLRSSHTHQRRFDSEELDRLGTLEVIASMSANEESVETITFLYKKAWSNCRSHWKKTISANNSAIGQLLDAYSEILIDILFETDGKFKPH